MIDYFITPFYEYVFMQRALIGGLIVSLGSVPVGIFMTLRRMSLTGDAMAHAILPGAAIAYLISGLSLLGLAIGGVVAGLIVALSAGIVARSSHIKEDASFASFYLIALAFGVLVISLKQSNVDLFHVLFGNILAVDDSTLWLLTFNSCLSLFVMAFLYRPLVIECFDSQFLETSGHASAVAHYGFLFLMVINLVSGFLALGTLMAIGIMVLPATAARFWVNSIDYILITALSFSFFSCYCGLLISYYFDLPSGPAIIMSMGVLCILSILIGANGGVLTANRANKHLKNS